MSELYNAEYYKQYDVGCGKVDYSDSEYTKGFLTQIAQKIVDDLHPKTVLDAGCAMGHLVAALPGPGCGGLWRRRFRICNFSGARGCAPLL